MTLLPVSSLVHALLSPSFLLTPPLPPSLLHSLLSVSLSLFVLCGFLGGGAGSDYVAQAGLPLASVSPVLGSLNHQAQLRIFFFSKLRTSLMLSASELQPSHLYFRSESLSQKLTQGAGT